MKYFSSSCFFRVVQQLALWRRGDLNQVKYSKEFEQTQYYGFERLRNLQLYRLQELLRKTFQHCPFYRQRFLMAGLRPDDIRSLEDLRCFPPLEKPELQREYSRMIAVNHSRGELVPNQTGGSTGTPVSFYISRDRMRSRTAATLRHNRWAGWEIGDKVAVLWGASQDFLPKSWLSLFRERFIDRQLFLDTGHLTEDKLQKYYRNLVIFKPKIMLAYARSAVLFAQFIRLNQLPCPSFHSIITSAEVLTEEERKLLEGVFCCPVFNRYGSREFSVIASECSAHHGLHVMAEGLYLEIVNGNKPCQPGELGTILITDLLNHAMPLIRYRIGDVSSWLPGTCSCGRGLPRIGEPAGRVTDFLVGSDGRVVSGAFLTIAIVAKRVSLGQVQILQERAGAVSFRIKPGPGFSEQKDLSYLVKTSKKFLGENTQITWELVADLPPQASGKYLFSRSTVVPEFLKPKSF